MSGIRTIILTGATRGLGRALVDEFIARGHTVCGCGRNAGACAALAERYPAPHDFTPVDVADHAAVEAWAARLGTSGHIPDLVINNAALMNRTVPLWQVPAAEFGRLMDVNVDGTVNVIRAFVPALLAAGRGVIVNLSSGWGRVTSPEVAPYCASKFAIEGLTGSLAAELPPPLAAVALNPGIIDTDMLRSCWAESAAAYEKPGVWAPRAAEMILGFDRADNGQSLTV